VGVGTDSACQYHGSGQRQITNLQDGGACNPEWSPDGEKIAFTVFNGKTRTIYVSDKNGNNTTRVIEGVAAHWSPDGTRIVFSRYPEEHNSKSSIWIANADGSGATKVFEDSKIVSGATWYPDGDSIVFASTRETPPDIYHVRLDGTQLEKIARDPQLAILSPVFSPDGKQLVVAAYDNSHFKSSIVLFDIASHEGKRMIYGQYPTTFLYPSVSWAKR
jgi:TolB protein